MCCWRRWRGSATGSCACRPSAMGRGWRSRRWSPRMRFITATRERAWRCCASIPTSEPRAGRAGLDPAVRRGPRDDALRRRARRGGTAPMRSTSTWAAPCRRSARPARARRCWTTPSWRSRSRAPRARARRRRARAAGHGQAALGPAPGRESGFELAHRLVEEAGVAAIALSSPLGGGPPQGRSRLRVGGAPGRIAAGAGDPDGRPERRRSSARGVRAHGRGGGDARARSARQPMAVRASCSADARVRARRAARSSRSWTGRSIAPSSTSASRARHATCASSIPGTCSSGLDPARASA